MLINFSKIEKNFKLTGDGLLKKIGNKSRKWQFVEIELIRQKNKNPPKH